MSIEIRSETAADVRAIEAVTIAAFLNAPHTGHNEHLIVDALREAGQLSISLVATLDGIVIGHVAVSPVSISDGSSGWYGLGPVSVAPDHQGRSVGSRLMREALRLLREQGAAGCVLVGEPAYYGRFGFQADPDLLYAGIPAEYFQCIAFTGSKARGDVAYHSAFNVST